MPLDIHLDPIESRVFGVLVEKALTTPEQYPLTLNSTTNACNQKSNRDPVLALDEDVVERTLQRLQEKYMARTVFPGGSRVEKYVHNGKDALALDAAGLAVIAELLLRGPQTPGDLRAHASRMIDIDSLESLAGILAQLMDKGYVRRLPPAPGSRAERYVQLLCPDLHPLEAPASPAAAEGTPRVAAGELAQRVAALEGTVEQLREEVRALTQRLGVARPS